MAKGENIFKRKDGRWEARYVKGYELSGKIRYGFCYGKTYKEAKEKAARHRAAAAEGITLPGKKGGSRFGFYCEEWLRSRKNKLKESTYVKYDTILRKHIVPRLGDCSPEAVTGGLIEDFTDNLLYGDMLAPKTVKDILVVLRSILTYSAKHNPGVFREVEIVYPKEIKKEMRVLSRDEQKILTAYLLKDMDACKFGVLLALITGIRIGELCELRWEAVSIQEKTIRITETMQRLRDMDTGGESRTRIVVGTPKSGNSIRIIPMTDYAVALCERMNPHCDTAFLLTGNEKYVEPRTLQYRLEKYVVDCGLEGVHFHTLRHTFATRCVEVGFDIKTLSEILGHATTTITLERYVHSSMELKRNNMKKLVEVGF